MEDDSAVLEEFRQQWRQEVNARTQRITQTARNTPYRSYDESLEKPKVSRLHPPAHHPAADLRDDDHDDANGAVAQGLSTRLDQLKVEEQNDDEFKLKPSHEPTSALEHYERAVEKEIEGKLGDSVSHYRKAFRLDSRVDHTYKNKHFPPQSKSQKSTSTTQAGDLPQPSSTNNPSNIPLTVADLVASFAGVPIAPAEPIIKGDVPPPCPIRNLPSEILHEIYLHAALSDPFAFVNLALVCKRFAYDVFSDMRVWKRIALGPEFGLSSQKYDFSCNIQGRPIIHETLDFREEDGLNDATKLEESHNQSWREVFHSHPRIRFTGVYISTVNYTRAGQGTATSSVWNTPVHIVTYYRYLRFFRDGTVISLLTTHEPVEVVHHLTKENMELIGLHPKEHHISSVTSAAPTVAGTAPAPHLPPTSQVFMKHALRGRWRLGHPSVDRDGNGIASHVNIEEGDVHIETEGVGPRYMYTMHLSLKSGSRSKTAVKNNKLQWRGFWSFNHLTNDWAEFQLKHDRAFVFSRVRGYGMGY